MSKVSGRLGKLAVSTDGSAYTDVGEVTSITPGGSHETEDATSFSSSGNKENDYGESQHSLSVDYLYDEADGGQDIIRTSFQNKTKLYYRYRPAGDTTDTEQRVFQGKIDSLETSNQRNAKVASKLQVVSSGAVTYSTVP